MRRLLGACGASLAGYGGLVLLNVVPHEAATAGAAALGIGAAMVAWSVRPGARAHLTDRSDAASMSFPPSPLTSSVSAPAAPARRVEAAVAGAGAVALIGTLAANLVRRSGLALPEWAIIAYGAALLAASRMLQRPIGRWRVLDAVAWSIPLVMAPLAMYALNALVAQAHAGALAGIIHILVVIPTAWALDAGGVPALVRGNNLEFATTRGTLVLGVGFVCAGLYPMVLFAGLVGLHAVRSGMAPRRAAAYLAIGLPALWAVNVLRLVIVARVGRTHGAAALQTVHAHIGWLLFGVFVVLFWATVPRLLDRRGARAVG